MIHNISQLRSNSTSRYVFEVLKNVKVADIFEFPLKIIMFLVVKSVMENIINLIV